MKLNLKVESRTSTLEVKSLNFMHSTEEKTSVNDYSREELRHYIKYNLFHKDDNIFGKMVASDYDPDALSGFSNLISDGSASCAKYNNKASGCEMTYETDLDRNLVTPKKQRRKERKDRKMMKVVNSCARLFSLFNKKREARERKPGRGYY